MKDELEWVARFKEESRRRDASSDDPAMAFYLRAARGRRNGVLSAVFPRFLRAFSNERSRLLDGFARRPQRDTDWYRNAAELLEVVEGLVDSGALPPWSTELARHEWTLFELGLERAELDTAAGINPTLRALEYQHDLPAWLSSSSFAASTPEVKTVQVGYYQHAETLESSWIELTPHVLAGLRVVMESLSVDETASALGVEAEAIRQSLLDLEKAGLFLSEETTENNSPSEEIDGGLE